VVLRRRRRRRMLGYKVAAAVGVEVGVNGVAQRDLSGAAG
jgi:hypothetical protein